jgi:RNA polymerase sigma factor (TIGR02999 family)
VYESGVSEVTRMLEAIEQGDPKAAEELLPLVYDELRHLAAYKMAGEAPGQTLQPTALVHEAWLRLAGNEQARFANRAHFFAAAAEAMRRILIDRARSKHQLRRGGDRQRVNLESVTVAIEDPDETVLAVHEALDKLAASDPLEAQIVKMRYFLGLTHQEIAAELKLSEPTVRRHWAYARAWLFAALKACR